MLPSLLSDDFFRPAGPGGFASLPDLSKPPQRTFTEPKVISCQKTIEPEDFTDNRIYVSNIPFSFVEEDLAKLFSRYGTVTDVQIVKNERGSKGFGFVTLDNQEGCIRARRDLHGTQIQGRIVEVRRATPARRIARPQPMNSPTVRPNNSALTNAMMSNLSPMLQSASQQLLSNFLYGSSPSPLSLGHPMASGMPFMVPQNAAQLLHPLGLGSYDTPQPLMASFAPPCQSRIYSSFVPQRGFTNGVAIDPWNLGHSMIPTAAPMTAERLVPNSLNHSFAPHSKHAQLMQDQLVSFLSLDSSMHGESVKQGQFGPIGSKAPSPPLPNDCACLPDVENVLDVSRSSTRKRQCGSPLDDSFAKVTRV